MKFDVAWKYKAEFKNRGGESRDERRLVPPSLRGWCPLRGLWVSRPLLRPPRSARRQGGRSERVSGVNERFKRESQPGEPPGEHAAGRRNLGGGSSRFGGWGGGLTQAESRRKDRRREPGEEGQEVVALRAGVQRSRVARSGVKG